MKKDKRIIIDGVLCNEELSSCIMSTIMFPEFYSELVAAELDRQILADVEEARVERRVFCKDCELYVKRRPYVSAYCWEATNRVNCMTGKLDYIMSDPHVKNYNYDCKHFKQKKTFWQKLRGQK